MSDPLLQIRNHHTVACGDPPIINGDDPNVYIGYVKESDMRWPLLVDESRVLYAAYGMHHGKWRDILGWSSWWAYAKLLFRGRRMHRSSGDLQQLSGDVLIDPAGVVRLHHIGTGPADRPSVSSLLDVARGQEGRFVESAWQEK